MILIISTCKEKLSEIEFVKPIENIVGKCVTKHFTEVTPEDVGQASKIIIAGTALKDFDYLEGNFDWLKNTNKPILGICAGMQLIAQAHNIPVEDFVTIGPRKVEIITENTLAEGSFNAYFLHTKTGTGDFQVLATTDGKACMIKHPNKDIYGVIFHPEVMNENIIRRFIQ